MILCPRKGLCCVVPGWAEGPGFIRWGLWLYKGGAAVASWGVRTYRWGCDEMNGMELSRNELVEGHDA